MSSGSHAGRPQSWIAVAVIFVGFAVSGVALCLGPSWAMFWAGAGVMAAGAVLALLVDVMGDVVLAEKRQVALADERA
ncbi:HGxxPAAW family protein [Actinomadura hibisca]|uniref:HGxxPAAW family protein n=1 Tax=Actinomadura hibisca TaxID=68565 RepID=UPI0009FCF3AA|nr:HGxxPAAW family protein [Actinomadura hibisca]